MGYIEDLHGQVFGRPRRRDLPHGTGIGPGGLNICPTPGMRIRSGGLGRGLARGGGRGPMRSPYGRRLGGWW